MAIEGMQGSRERLSAETENFTLSLSQGGNAVGIFTTALNTAANVISGHIGGQPGGGPMLPPANWRGIDLSRTSGPMAMPTITPMRQGSVNPAFLRPMAGPVTIHVTGAPGQSVDELAKAVQQRLGKAQYIQARSTYDGGR
jgi:hypothetical protein